MRHHQPMILCALLLSACSAVVNIDLDGGEDASSSTGEESSTSGSTGLSGSDTGAPGTTWASDSSDGSTGPVGTTTGDPLDGSDTSSDGSTGSTTGGSSSGGSSTGDPTTGGQDCLSLGIVEFAPGLLRCECDGVPANPAECGCFLDGTGSCACPEASYAPIVCGWPCVGVDDVCTCGNFPASDPYCDGWCPNMVPPQPCPM